MNEVWDFLQKQKANTEKQKAQYVKKNYFHEMYKNDNGFGVGGLGFVGAIVTCVLLVVYFHILWWIATLLCLIPLLSGICWFNYWPWTWPVARFLIHFQVAAPITLILHLVVRSGNLTKLSAEFNEKIAQDEQNNKVNPYLQVSNQEFTNNPELRMKAYAVYLDVHYEKAENDIMEQHNKTQSLLKTVQNIKNPLDTTEFVDEIIKKLKFQAQELKTAHNKIRERHNELRDQLTAQQLELKQLQEFKSVVQAAELVKENTRFLNELDTRLQNLNDRALACLAPVKTLGTEVSYVLKSVEETKELFALNSSI